MENNQIHGVTDKLYACHKIIQTERVGTCKHQFGKDKRKLSTEIFYFSRRNAKQCVHVNRAIVSLSWTSVLNWPASSIIIQPDR